MNESGATHERATDYSHRSQQDTDAQSGALSEPERTRFPEGSINNDIQAGLLASESCFTQNLPAIVSLTDLRRSG